MRIAQVAPLAEPVPPLLYGGTERIVSFLTECLVDMGHDVTLFASGDSQTGARLDPIVPTALRLGDDLDFVSPHVLEVERVLEVVRDEGFDVVHFHIAPFHYPLADRVGLTHVTTLHGRLDMTIVRALYDRFSHAPVVSISEAQRRPLPNANWQATVHHGIPVERFPAGMPEGRSGGYLAFVGRVSPEKGLGRAVEVARSVGLPLVVAGKVDRVDREFFDAEVAPLLEQPHVDFLGEVEETRKLRVLAEAEALLFPIDWPEPFGLVMIEAMACGTPVIAFRNGAVPEVVEDGVTGFVVADVDAACRAVPRAMCLERGRVRRRCAERFGVQRMASDYLAVYRRLARSPSLVGFRPALDAGFRAAPDPTVLTPRLDGVSFGRGA